MILVIVCTVAALLFGLFLFSQNNERSEVPEQAAAIDVPDVAPSSSGGNNDLHPAADPTQ